MATQTSRLREIGSWIIVNALWVPFAFQDAALLTIAVPAAVLVLAPHTYVMVTSIIGSATGFAAMLVPPLAGWFSDHLRRGGGQRRTFVAAGLAINVLALVLIATVAHTLWSFAALYVLSVAGSNVAQAAYQALLPETVPRAQWGAVSGVRGGLTLIGTIVGLGIAGVAPDPRITFLGAAVVVALCASTLLFIREVEWTQPSHAHVRDRHDFFVVFAARFLVFFGLQLLQQYVLFYFRDVLHLDNAPAGTALAAGSTMLGAIGSAIYLGIVSDRAPRKTVTALAGIPMTAAAIGFAIAPAPQWMFLYAFLFGIGFGGVFSVGWALAMDSIPTMGDVARDLGIWGIASNLPASVAPLIGGPIITAFHGTRPGYQAVFGLAGFSFALASVTVLRVGRKPLSSLWAWPLRMTAYLTNFVYDRTAYRIRDFGRLPRKRGATLVVANHQHDLESQVIVTTIAFRSGPLRHPVFTACSRRMFEPGFMAQRIPWTSWLLRRWNPGPLFAALGLLPIENDLNTREISALAFSAQRRHGDLPLSQVFDERVSERFAAGAKTSDLWKKENFLAAHTFVKVATLREPYRGEMLAETREYLEEDLARIESVVRRGGTFYITPEGHYSKTGRMGKMLGALYRLAPLATIYVAGISYDPFVAKRFSMLFRVGRLQRLEHIAQTLAAIRPVVTSQLLAAWLEGRGDAPFSQQDAVTGVQERLHSLPAGLFADPELRRDPPGMVARALAWMTQLGLLARDGAGYRLTANRRHAQFPFVADIVGYNARFLEETIANAAYHSEAIVVE